MKTILLVLVLSAINFAQSTSINLAGYDVELGMYSETVWKLLSPIFLVSENDEGNYYVSDKGDNPVGIIIFKDDKVVKVIKDWGTTNKTNVGAVFKILWNIFRQYGEKSKISDVIAKETFSPTGEKYSLFFTIDKYHYIEINIFRNAAIYEVLEDQTGKF